MEISHTGSRFYMKTPHGEAELLYRIDGNVMSIYHTFVPEEDRGKGLAEKLSLSAFEFAEKNKLKVSPDCPYIKHFIEKHKILRN